MRILVLGNGFDIDHDLPTSYSDFLTFCECLRMIDTPDAPCFTKLKDKQKAYFERLQHDEELKSAFLGLLQKNLLLTYFLARRDKQGHNWIDLEREIKNIVNEFRALEYSLGQSSQVRYSVDKDHRIHQVVKELGLEAMETGTWNEISLAAMHESLLYCHEQFSKALELYISEFVNKTDIQGISPDIIEFDADNVLTFNYSDTYERVYGGVKWRDAIFHVHGIAQSSLGKHSDIILGITSDDAWAEKSYVEFEKYYQRITKQSGMTHTKWLTTSHEEENIEVVFFGHSLDASDSDIITDFLRHKKSSVTIYYYNESAHQQIVANLIKILGKSELISYISGETPKITFKSQRSHENDNNAGIEIVRDIRKLYHMHSMSNEEIIAFIEKLEHKIQIKDTRYFHSQKNAISLFEALRHSKLKRSANAIQDICSMLPYVTNAAGNLVLYDSGEWEDHTPWGDPIDCDVETLQLVNTVNRMNQVKCQERACTSLHQQIPVMQTVDNMVDALNTVLSEDVLSGDYWKKLNTLAEALVNNPLSQDAFAKLGARELPVPTRIRLQHFISMYEEAYYNYHLMKEMAEWDYSDEEQ